ncbi:MULTISPECIES: helix-turn-helix domain-containing protein [Halobacillus]|uniref:helix-turn-helix domain-containing protein n=1 Tax=Halobacillus TaxID=45667 RepID=UPI001CD6F432|nr:helix-turn-helix transcriptional regulator [Halobacillus litoralis]MCA1021025.1 helix-turn-helix domain-containing protein [Halobacillus litoralis]
MEVTPIGEKIRVLRTGRGLSVNEFAKRSGVSKSYISNIERGVQKNPSLIVMGKLARTLEVPLEELLTHKYAEETRNGQS